MKKWIPKVEKQPGFVEFCSELTLILATKQLRQNSYFSRLQLYFPYFFKVWRTTFAIPTVFQTLNEPWTVTVIVQKDDGFKVQSSGSINSTVRFQNKQHLYKKRNFIDVLCVINVPYLCCLLVVLAAVLAYSILVHIFQMGHKDQTWTMPRKSRTTVGWK